MFHGSITALITPFKNGEIDWPAFDKLIEWQIENGTHALVPCGTTGESPTLSHDEHKAIVERCVDVVKGRIPIIAGSGSNSTKEAVELTQHARESGADAALVVTPYYNKPSQAGMYAHFKAVHDEGDMPIIIYNIPGRSIVDMDIPTMASLAKLPNIVGVKDATSDLSRPLLTHQTIDGDFCQLSGDDVTALAFLAQGGHGCISVMANVAPKECADMHNAWRAGNYDRANALRDRLCFLAVDLFCESSPAPTKYVAHKLGLCAEESRLPIIPLTDEGKETVDRALKHAGISAA